MTNNWSLLKDLLAITKDGEWGKGDPEPGFVEMAVIRGTDFEAVRFGDTSTVPIRYIPGAIAARKKLQPGDILIETAGGTKDQPTGRTVFLKQKLFTPHSRPFTCASFSRFLRVDDTLAEPEYVFWYLKHLYNKGEMHPYHVQHTGVARFQYTDFASKTRVPLPHLSKQRAIAQILGSLDDKIEQNLRINETLEAMARSIFKDWFVDFGPTRAKVEGHAPYLAPELWKLFPDALDDADKPVGWKLSTLASYATLNPETWSRANAPEIINYVDLANTKWGAIESIQHYNWADAPSRAQRILREGDTIVGTVRPGNGSYTLISNDGLTGSTGFAVLRPINARFREFVYLASTSSDNIARLSHLADGAAYPAVRPNVVVETDIVLPSEEVINCFSRIAAPLINRMETNKQENETLAQTRDLLLPKLMSGETHLRDSEKIVEEVAS